MIAASAGMAALLWGLALVLETPLETAGLRIPALAALILAGLAGYGALAALSGGLPPSELRALLRRRQGRG